jgi:hypothetical protein
MQEKRLTSTWQIFCLEKSSQFFTVGICTLFYWVFITWAHLVWLWVAWSGERAGRYTLSLSIPDQAFQSLSVIKKNDVNKILL